jgi:hypothetical protein
MGEENNLWIQSPVKDCGVWAFNPPVPTVPRKFVVSPSPRSALGQSFPSHQLPWWVSPPSARVLPPWFLRWSCDLTLAIPSRTCRLHFLSWWGRIYCLLFLTCSFAVWQSMHQMLCMGTSGLAVRSMCQVSPTWLLCLQWGPCRIGQDFWVHGPWILTAHS